MKIMAAHRSGWPQGKATQKGTQAPANQLLEHQVRGGVEKPGVPRGPGSHSRSAPESQDSGLLFAPFLREATCLLQSDRGQVDDGVNKSEICEMRLFS